MNDEQKTQIKLKNEAIIKNEGYCVNDWLPILDSPNLRTLEEIKGRMSVMNALINIAFKAPTYVIEEWIEEHDLTKYLSTLEKALLGKENHELTDYDINSLKWYLESLWALMWVTGMIPELEAENHVGNDMASLLPNLQRGENNKKLEDLKLLKPEIEIYKMLDYYFRLHWYCVDERLNGRKGKLNEGIILERRKSLEWVFNRSEDWDSVDMST